MRFAGPSLLGLTLSSLIVHTFQKDVRTTRISLRRRECVTLLTLPTQPCCLNEHVRRAEPLRASFGGL